MFPLTFYIPVVPPNRTGIDKVSAVFQVIVNTTEMKPHISSGLHHLIKAIIQQRAMMTYRIKPPINVGKRIPCNTSMMINRVQYSVFATLKNTDFMVFDSSKLRQLATPKYSLLHSCLVSLLKPECNPHATWGFVNIW